jgi:hypothetical protein
MRHALAKRRYNPAIFAGQYFYASTFGG